MVNKKTVDELQADLTTLRQVNEALMRENARRAKLMSISHELVGQMSLEDLLPIIITKVTRVMDANRSSIFLYDAEEKELWSLVCDELEISEIRMPADSGIAGHVAHTRETLNVPDAYDLDYFDRSWDEKTGYRTRSVLCVPMCGSQGELLGVLQVLNKKDGGIFNYEDQSFLEALTGQIAIHVENASLHNQIRTLFEDFVNAISIALEGRDPVTAGHSRRVTEYTLAIAIAMHKAREGPFKDSQFTRSELRELRYAGLLHDLGKVGVPEALLQKAERLPINGINVVKERFGRLDVENYLGTQQEHKGPETLRQKIPGDVEMDSIFLQKELKERLEFLKTLNKSGFLSDVAEEDLNKIHNDRQISEIEYDYLSIKQGNLTEKERLIMQSHVIKTWEVLSAVPWLKNMRNIPMIAANHHECPNGKGYPKGLTKEEIPLESLMMAVADVYDALTAQDRPYKPAIPHEKSADILREMAQEGMLDADIVDLFLNEHLYLIDEEIGSGSSTVIFRKVEAAI